MQSLCHWNIFRSIEFIAQDAVGDAPVQWAKKNHVAHNLNDYPFANNRLKRSEVKEICHSDDNNVLVGYLCVMAWGAQGAGPGGKKAVASSWQARESIAAILNKIRNSSLTRAQAYNLFLENKIPGLGPAYFTKLIYFFLKNQPIGYIMDQWTAKSVNLLTGCNVVLMGGNSPSNRNKAENYELFCEVIDSLAKKLECSGDELEERLFSQNGRHGRKRGAWRQHVHTHWDRLKPSGRCNPSEISDWLTKFKTDLCF